MYYNETSIQDNRNALVQIVTDELFTCGARFIAKSYREQKKIPVFAYNFGYGFVSKFWGPYAFCCEGHACHGAELPFVFDLFAEPSMSYMHRHKADESVGAKTNAYWVEFIKTKDVDETTRLGPKGLVPWPQYDPMGEQVWMNLTATTPNTTTPNTTTNFRREECDMFDEFGYMLWQ